MHSFPQVARQVSSVALDLVLHSLQELLEAVPACKSPCCQDVAVVMRDKLDEGFFLRQDGLDLLKGACSVRAGLSIYIRDA